MFQNIILAYDGSEYSNKALKCAQSIAERFEATLWLVHIFPHTSDLMGYEDFEKFFAKRKSTDQAVLNRDIFTLSKAF
jgi:nucleotide-binding universal stress UspA family protein